MQRQLISSGSTFENDIGYSRAVVQGDWVFVSGTTGFDYATMTIAEGIEAQAEQCLKNVESALLRAGSCMADIVRINYVVPHAEEFSLCWPVLRRYLGDVRPASMMISASLLEPRMRIEMEVTALKQPPGVLAREAGEHAGQPLPVAMRALDVEPPSQRTLYPEPFASMVGGRVKRRLGDAFGLSNFGVNLTRLAPGAISSLRHAHTKQDEFVYILEGHPTLVTDQGPTKLAPGLCAGFKSGSGDAHHLKNETALDVWVLEVGDRTPDDSASYPDDDIQGRQVDGQWLFARKDGSPIA